MINKCIASDVRSYLRSIPSETVQLVVTSTPYWALRSYEGDQDLLWGVDDKCECEWDESFCIRCGAWNGALGNEPTPGLFIKHLVEIFEEVKRVLRNDGVVLLNIGDTYIGSGGAGGDYNVGGKREGQPKYRQSTQKIPDRNKALIPDRLRVALQEAGWIIRDNITWIKGREPEDNYEGSVGAGALTSVNDRCTPCTEDIIQMSKTSDYFWDYVAIMEKGKIPAGVLGAKSSKSRAKASKVNSRPCEYYTYTGMRRRRNAWFFPTMPRNWEYCTGCSSLWVGKERKECAIFSEKKYWCPNCDTNENFIKHFAAFPPSLPALAIKVGTSERGMCIECGTPWQRTTNDWKPGCECNTDQVQPCIVLDPFMGSGTTGIEAIKLGRNFLGCDLSQNYVLAANARIEREMQSVLRKQEQLEKITQFDGPLW